MRRKVKRMIEKILNPEEQGKIDKWKRVLEKDRQAYESIKECMVQNESLYRGDREIAPNPNSRQPVTKLATNIRNMVYELIESQADSSIPRPKITPIHAGDEKLARIIEQVLENEIRLLHFNTLNDLQERTVPVVGGSLFLVEWDKNKGFHCNLGGLNVSGIHPSEIIPQAGVHEIDRMDHIFVLECQTKDYIKNKYGVDVSNAQQTETKTHLEDDTVTVYKVYYRNEKGGVGLFTWCDVYILEEMEDYQARKLERCKKCGEIKRAEVCECGSKSFERVDEDSEELTADITQITGAIIPAVKWAQEEIELENGDIQLAQVEHRTKIPYYKPNCYPLVLRRNVSRYNSLLGFSDVEMIQDHQETIKKLGSKINEKLLKGGSVLVKPEHLKIRTTDEELKVVDVRNAAEAAMIDVKNFQVDVTMDRYILEQNYQWAKSTLGITDSFQGKYDSSATSGTAKQYSINQAAGRLESKRVMKNEAYSRLYEMMFKFLLAYADEKIPMSRKVETGEYEYSHFNRYDFLKMDAAGEYYWNDEFIFETDPTSTIMMNREAMWAQADFKLQSGAFGPLGDASTLLHYWTFMEQNDYPNASEMRQHFEAEYQKQQQALMQQQLMMQMGGMPQ